MSEVFDLAKFPAHLGLGATAEQLNENGKPGHQIRKRNTERVHDMHECIGALFKLGIAVSNEAIAHDEAKGNRRPTRRISKEATMACICVDQVLR